MPFTPAHTAVVLPFLRWQYVSATGLVVGSIAPDFEYFLKMSVNSRFSHTIAGLFYFDLPVIILLSIGFHHVVKENLFANSPRFIQKRFQEVWQFNFVKSLREHPWRFCLSGLAATATHVLWDSFTHGNGFFAKNLSFYKGSYVPFDGVNYPLFYALQQISTGVGLTVLILFIVFRKPVHRARVCRPLLDYWIWIVIITGAVVAIRFFLVNDFDLGNGIVSLISGLCIALLITGLMTFDNPREDQVPTTGSV
jgi:hypothetical protein